MAGYKDRRQKTEIGGLKILVPLIGFILLNLGLLLNSQQYGIIPSGFHYCIFALL